MWTKLQWTGKGSLNYFRSKKGSLTDLTLSVKNTIMLLCVSDTCSQSFLAVKIGKVENTL